MSIEPVGRDAELGDLNGDRKIDLVTTDCSGAFLSLVLWNRQLLFIHVPKTAGMSITEHLMRWLSGPVYVAMPEGHEPPDPPQHVRVVQGRRHATLEQAREALARYGVNLYDVPLISAVVRNPYEIEVSRFFYLRQGNPWDAGPDQELAMSGNFEDFVVGVGCESLRMVRYYTLDGRIPCNLQVLRFELLEEDFTQLANFLGLPRTGPLPKENVTSHRPYSEYMTPRMEEFVYRRYKWMFDSGRYPRESFS